MRTKTVVLTLGLLLAVGGLCAANPNMGTWKLNQAKSKITAGTAKNTEVTYSNTMMGKIKVTVDGTDGAGKPAHNSWTGKFDGKDYPVTGDPTSDSRSVKKINDHTLEAAVKKGEKVTLTAHILLSADGKTRTVTVNGTDPMGKKYHSVAVYDKQ